MITVIFIRKANTFSLEARGHAGFDNIGKDIVCSAASMLTYAISESVIQMYKENKTVKKPKTDIREGYSLLTVESKEEHAKEMQYKFDVALTGFRMLQHSYPDNVAFITMDEGF